MPETVRHVNLRLPDDLAEAVRQAAREDARSLNAEILVALREWLAGRSRKR